MDRPEVTRPSRVLPMSRPVEGRCAARGTRLAGFIAEEAVEPVGRAERLERSRQGRVTCGRLQTHRNHHWLRAAKPGGTDIFNEAKPGSCGVNRCARRCAWRCTDPSRKLRSVTSLDCPGSFPGATYCAAKNPEQKNCRL